MKQITQVAPWPEELEDLVEHFRYRPGWKFFLHESLVRDHEDPNDDTSPPVCWGTTLDIITLGYDSYHPERGQQYGVHHYRIVPAATFNRESWEHWLLQQCIAVDTHEVCEFYVVAYEGHEERPFRPVHAPGWDPYMVTVNAPESERSTSYRGIRKEQ